MSTLEIKNDLLLLLVETDDAELLDSVRNYFKQLKKEKTPKKKVATKGTKEATLVKQIKSTYPVKDNKRYKELRAKIESGQISGKEQKELIELTNKFESLDAQRLQCLLQLAELRNQSLNILLKEFAPSPAYA